MGNCITHKGDVTVLSSSLRMPRGRLGSAEATYRSFEYLSPVTSNESIQVEVEETTTVTRTHKKKRSKILFKKKAVKDKKTEDDERSKEGFESAPQCVPEILVTSPGGACRKATSVGVSDENHNVSHFMSYTHIDIPEVPLGSYLLRQFDLHGDQVAVIDSQSDESYRYRDMAEMVRRIASALWKRGFRQGNTVCVVSTNSIEVVPVMCAALCSGGTCALIEPTIPVVTLSRRMREIHPMVIVTETPLADACLRATATAGILTEIYTIGKVDGFHPLSELQGDNGSCFPTGIKLQPKKTCALILFSTEHVSVPKPVLLSHYSVLSNALQVLTTFGLKRGSTLGCFLPLTHHFGLIGTLMCGLLAGTKVILVKTDTIEYCITALIKYKPRRIHLSPDLAVTMFDDEMISLCDLSNLEHLLCGPSPLTPEAQSAIAGKVEPAIVSQAYGSTSTLITHCGCTLSPSPSGSCGSLVPNTACKILEIGTRTPLYTDTSGEIWVSGPQCTMSNGQITPRKIRQTEEWLYTGDVGKVDGKGNLFVQFSKPLGDCYP